MDKIIGNKLDQTIQQGTSYIDKKLQKHPKYQVWKSKYWKYIWPATLIGFAIYAVHLSWKCSAIKDGYMYSRITSAIFAGLLNIVYVLYYYMARTDTCFIMKKLVEIEKKI
jgi:uncharacterized membrane protein (DUF485 family)